LLILRLGGNSLVGAACCDASGGSGSRGTTTRSKSSSLGGFEGEAGGLLRRSRALFRLFVIVVVLL